MMKSGLIRTAATGVGLAVMLSIAWRALAGGALVIFPERYKVDRMKSAN